MTGKRVLYIFAAVMLGLSLLPSARTAPAPPEPPPTFYRDVLPILAEHCQSCHSPGDIGPMPLVTYKQAAPLADAIQDATRQKEMPPWFADPHFGHFSND